MSVLYPIFTCSEKKPDPVRKEGKSSPKSDNYLLGYRVVARNAVDGFYYPGYNCEHVNITAVVISRGMIFSILNPNF